MSRSQSQSQARGGDDDADSAHLQNPVHSESEIFAFDEKIKMVK
jgi:hypothetical protein